MIPSAIPKPDCSWLIISIVVIVVMWVGEWYIISPEALSLLSCVLKYLYDKYKILKQ